MIEEPKFEQGEQKKENSLLTTIIEWTEKAKSADEEKFNTIKPREATLGFVDYLLQEAKKAGVNVDLSKEDIAKGYELFVTRMEKVAAQEAKKCLKVTSNKIYLLVRSSVPSRCLSGALTANYIATSSILLLMH